MADNPHSVKQARMMRVAAWRRHMVCVGCSGSLYPCANAQNVLHATHRGTQAATNRWPVLDEPFLDKKANGLPGLRSVVPWRVRPLQLPHALRSGSTPMLSTSRWSSASLLPGEAASRVGDEPRQLSESSTTKRVTSQNRRPSRSKNDTRVRGQPSRAAARLHRRRQRSDIPA